MNDEDVEIIIHFLITCLRKLEMPSLFHNLTVRIKLMALSLTLIALTYVVIGVGVTKMQLIGEEITAVAERDIPLTAVVTQITIHYLEQSIHLERAMRYSEEKSYRAGMEQKIAKEKQLYTYLSNKIHQEIKAGEKLAMESAQASAFGGVSEYDYVNTVLKKIDVAHVSYEKEVEQLFSAIEVDNVNAAINMMGEIESAEEKIIGQLEALLLRISKFTDEAILTAKHDEESGLRILLISGLVITVIGLSLSLFMTNAIAKGLASAVSAAKNIAAGDLSQKINVTGKDEIGELLLALDVMRNNLREIVTKMSESSSQLATSSEELSAVTGETNEVIYSQSVEIEQVVTAINEMTATIQEVAKTTADTSSITATTQLSTTNGQKLFESTVSSISDLAGEIENTSQVINRLESDSEAISGILDVIKNIAEQTNLLALNAAIEAARAGEQGRGFAVVADEVRTLASRTQESTQEIEQMIAKLQAGSRAAVSAMALNKESATSSVEQASKAGAALDGIATAILEISDMNVQIASAAEEQSIVTEEINRNISTVNDFSARTTEGSKETAVASENLAMLATKMNDLVQRFKVA